MSDEKEIQGGDSIPDAVDESGKEWMAKKDEQSIEDMEARIDKDLDPIKRGW